MNKNTLLLVFSALIIGLLFNSIYIVDEKQKVKISNKLNNKKPIIDIKNTDEIIKVLNVNWSKT